MSEILDPSALLSSLPKYLPTDKELKNPQDALAVLIHTILSDLAFRLVGIDEDSSPSTYEGNVLPEAWNKHSPGNYTLRYRHEQSSLEFLVKISKLSNRTLIHAIASETNKTASLDISTNDFTSPSFYPHKVGAAERGPLVNGFIASNRISDFVSQFKLAILQKILPGLRKEGYTEDVNVSNSSERQSSSRNQNEPDARPNPSSGGPRVPYRSDSHILPENPLQIGRSDLDPLPLQIQPNSFAPPSLFPSSQGDGMYVGPDHPIFNRREPTRGSGVFGIPQGTRGPWGGDGYLPPLGVPPGARFDPIVPGSFGPRGNIFGGGFSGGRAPQRGGDPDNDELMPPGVNDMFM